MLALNFLCELHILFYEVITFSIFILPGKNRKFLSTCLSLYVWEDMLQQKAHPAQKYLNEMVVYQKTIVSIFSPTPL